MMNVLQIKAAVRERDGLRCVKCGMTNFEHILTTGRQLDVHRVDPGSEYAVEGCITVCRACHGSEPKLPRGEGQRRIAEVTGWFPIKVTLRPRIAAQLEKLVVQNGTTADYEIIRAIEEYLERHNLWPPPSGDSIN